MKNVKPWPNQLILCALWILATIVGMIVGINFIRLMFWGTEVGFAFFWLLVTLGGFAGGIVMGLLQWLVLRNWVKGVGWWIGVTAVGFTLLGLFMVWSSAGGWWGILVDNRPSTVTIEASLLGGLMGISQWLVLRKKLKRAGWWIPASIIGWAVDSLVLVPNFDNSRLLLSLLVSGVLAGITTGVTLVLLVARNRRLLDEDNEATGTGSRESFHPRPR